MHYKKSFFSIRKALVKLFSFAYTTKHTAFKINNNVLESMKIAIGADHRGFVLKSYLMSFTSLAGYQIEWVDCGTHSIERTDYPIYAKRVAEAVKDEKVEKGVLLCGTGVGMAVAANRLPYVYAAVFWNPHIACIAREDDNVNIAVLASDYVADQEAQTILKAWLTCSFKKERYQERLRMIDEG